MRNSGQELTPDLWVRPHFALSRYMPKLITPRYS